MIVDTDEQTNDLTEVEMHDADVRIRLSALANGTELAWDITLTRLQKPSGVTEKNQMVYISIK